MNSDNSWKYHIASRLPNFILTGRCVRRLFGINFLCLTNKIKEKIYDESLTITQRENIFYRYENLIKKLNFKEINLSVCSNKKEIEMLAVYTKVVLKAKCLEEEKLINDNIYSNSLKADLKRIHEKIDDIYIKYNITNYHKTAFKLSFLKKLKKKYPANDVLLSFINNLEAKIFNDSFFYINPDSVFYLFRKSKIYPLFLKCFQKNELKKSEVNIPECIENFKLLIKSRIERHVLIERIDLEVMLRGYHKLLKLQHLDSNFDLYKAELEYLLHFCKINQKVEGTIINQLRNYVNSLRKAIVVNNHGKRPIWRSPKMDHLAVIENGPPGGHSK